MHKDSNQGTGATRRTRASHSEPRLLAAATAALRLADKSHVRNSPLAAMSKLRRLILRGEPDKGEASLLRGVLQSIVIAGERGKLEE